MEGAETLNGNSVHPFFALRVRSNFEKHADAFLSSLGYGTFLPTYRARKRWSDRVKESEFPLFPGYVFCRLDLSDIRMVLRTPGYLSIVGLGRVPAPIPAGEIEVIRRAVGSGASVSPWPFLNVGQRVLLTDGPLSGVEGILLRIKNAYKIVVSIDLLQRSVAAEIDPLWVRPISNVTMPKQTPNIGMNSTLVSALQRRRK